MIKNGIRKKTLINFLVFTAIILTVLWLLQIIFFSTFYEAMKKKVLQRATNEIVEVYGTTDYQEHMNEIAYKNELSVVVFVLEGNKLNILNTAGRVSIGSLSDEVLEKFFGALGDKTSVNYVTSSGDNNEQTTITYGVAGHTQSGKKLYFYVNTTLMPTDSTSSVLQQQLLIITGICILLALILSYAMANHISKPLENLTRSANELAHGNLNVSFSTDGFGEVQELANTLNYATEEIRKSDKLRKELMANVSHELKTPLTIIKAYSELIRDISGNNCKKREEHLQIILSEADRLTNLVNDILDLSKLEAGVSEFNMDNFNISVCVNRVYNMFATLYSAQGYNFECDIDDGVMAYGDEDRVEQVVFNMIANAVNYSKDKKNITVKLNKKEDCDFRFECIDTGKGIAEEDIASIFDRFFRTEETKRISVGSGIGLSLVKIILDAHDWTYGVNSKIGEGSTFYFEGKSDDDGNTVIELGGGNSGFISYSGLPK